MHINPEQKLITYCNACKRAICSIYQEEFHTEHDIDMDIIRKSVSKEKADNFLK